MEQKHLLYKSRIFNYEFEADYKNDIQNFKEILIFLYDKRKLEKKENADSVFQYLLNIENYNSFYEHPKNIEKDDKIRKYYSSLFNEIIIASIRTVEFIEKDLERTIGVFQQQLFRRLVLDFFTYYEFYNGYNHTSITRSHDIVNNVKTINFFLCEENNNKNSIPENNLLIYLCLELRRLIEFFFLELLKKGKAIKNVYNVKIKDIKKLFIEANKGGAISVHEFNHIVQSYEFLSNAIHRNNTPYIFSILFIYSYLLDNYFNYEKRNSNDFIGELVLINYNINEIKLKNIMEEYLKNNNHEK